MTWKNYPDIPLYQYRGVSWPVIGSFAVGLCGLDGTGDWNLEVTRTDIEVRTPWGGVYAWVRGW